MAKLNINCPHCYENLQIQEEWWGLEMECPVCQNKFVIGATRSGKCPLKISLWQYFIQATFCKYSFEGRACRKEYWGFELFWAIILVIPYIFIWCFSQNEEELSTIFFPINLLHVLLSACMLARRLHDLGKHAKNWIIAYLIWSVINLTYDFFNISDTFISSMEATNNFVTIISIVIGCIKGNEGDNEFGKDPLRSNSSLKKIDPLSSWIFIAAIFGGILWKIQVVSNSLS